MAGNILMVSLGVVGKTTGEDVLAEDVMKSLDEAEMMMGLFSVADDRDLNTYYLSC